MSLQSQLQTVLLNSTMRITWIPNLELLGCLAQNYISPEILSKDEAVLDNKLSMDLYCNVLPLGIV